MLPDPNSKPGASSEWVPEDRRQFVQPGQATPLLEDPILPANHSAKLFITKHLSTGDEDERMAEWFSSASSAAHPSTGLLRLNLSRSICRPESNIRYTCSPTNMLLAEGEPWQQSSSAPRSGQAGQGAPTPRLFAVDHKLNMWSSNSYSQVQHDSPKVEMQFDHPDDNLVLQVNSCNNAPHHRPNLRILERPLTVMDFRERPLQQQSRLPPSKGKEHEDLAWRGCATPDPCSGPSRSWQARKAQERARDILQNLCSSADDATLAAAATAAGQPYRGGPGSVCNLPPLQSLTSPGPMSRPAADAVQDSPNFIPYPPARAAGASPRHSRNQRPAHRGGPLTPTPTTRVRRSSLDLSSDAPMHSQLRLLSSLEAASWSAPSEVPVSDGMKADVDHELMMLDEMAAEQEQQYQPRPNTATMYAPPPAHHGRSPPSVPLRPAPSPSASRPGPDSWGTPPPDPRHVSSSLLPCVVVSQAPGSDGRCSLTRSVLPSSPYASFTKTSGDGGLGSTGSLEGNEVCRMSGGRDRCSNELGNGNSFGGLRATPPPTSTYHTRATATAHTSTLFAPATTAEDRASTNYLPPEACVGSTYSFLRTPAPPPSPAPISSHAAHPNIVAAVSFLGRGQSTHTAPRSLTQPPPTVEPLPEQGPHPAHPHFSDLHGRRRRSSSSRDLRRNLSRSSSRSLSPMRSRSRGRISHKGAGWSKLGGLLGVKTSAANTAATFLSHLQVLDPFSLVTSARRRKAEMTKAAASPGQAPHLPHDQSPSSEDEGESQPSSPEHVPAAKATNATMGCARVGINADGVCDRDGRVRVDALWEQFKRAGVDLPTLTYADFCELHPVVQETVLARYERSQMQPHVRRRHHGLVQANPVAFEEEAAEVAEAEYQAAAERARLRLQALCGKSGNARHSSEFRDALRGLAVRRPYFQAPNPSQLKEQVVAARSEVARGPGEEVEQWRLEDSVFGPRRRENDARGFYDTEDALDRQFDMDWSRVVCKTRFKRMVTRQDEGVVDGVELDRELKEVRDELRKHFKIIRTAFIYYSSYSGVSSSDSYLSIHLMEFHRFCRDCGLADARVPGIRPSDLDTMFISTNYEEEQGTQEADANDDNALCRFEFLEILVRLAVGRFIVPRTLTDASDSVERLLEQHVLPTLPHHATTDPNVFRRTRLYSKEMEDVVVAHYDLLRATHAVYRARDRTKLFWVEHWMALLESTNMVGPHTGISKHCAKFVFGLSQAVVVDELRRRQRAVSLQFFDFIEALARLADIMDPPTPDQVAAFFARVHGVRGGAGSKGGDRGRGGDNSGDGDSEGFSSGDGAGGGSAGQGGAVRTQSSTPTSPAPTYTIADYYHRLQQQPSLQSLLPTPPKPQQPSTSGADHKGGEGGSLSASPRVNDRPMADKFSVFMDYLLAELQAAWGGSKEAQTTARMNKMAVVLSGGIQRAQ